MKQKETPHSPGMHHYAVSWVPRSQEAGLPSLYLLQFSYVYFIYLFLFIFPPFIFISWRLITLQYCSGFCHTLTWISHGFTCVPHPLCLFYINVQGSQLCLGTSTSIPPSKKQEPTWAFLTSAFSSLEFSRTTSIFLTQLNRSDILRCLLFAMGSQLSTWPRWTPTCPVRDKKSSRLSGGLFFQSCRLAMGDLEQSPKDADLLQLEIQPGNLFQGLRVQPCEVSSGECRNLGRVGNKKRLKPGC